MRALIGWRRMLTPMLALLALSLCGCGGGQSSPSLERANIEGSISVGSGKVVTITETQQKVPGAVHGDIVHIFTHIYRMNDSTVYSGGAPTATIYCTGTDSSVILGPFAMTPDGQGSWKCDFNTDSYGVGAFTGMKMVQIATVDVDGTTVKTPIGVFYLDNRVQ